MSSNNFLLEVVGLRRYFSVGRGLLLRRQLGWIKAVDGVSFSIGEQQTLGLVGESGCGKTTTARLLLKLDRPTEGRILFKGEDISSQSGDVSRRYRRSVQAVFQDPWGSLDPRMRVEDIVAEPLQFNTALPGNEIRHRVGELLSKVGLQDRHAQLYPHEFSGGQRQRIALARAMALNPDLIVLDEPVSALDVSIRAQIMNLLKDVQETYRLSYILIAHNLATVRYLSDNVAVMYLGKIVELSDSEALFCQPLHPYTQALLLAALPGHPRDRRQMARLLGEVPSPIAPPPGCTFHTRCPSVLPVCSEVAPQLQEIAPKRWAACHLYSKSGVERAYACLNGGSAPLEAMREDGQE